MRTTKSPSRSWKSILVITTLALLPGETAGANGPKDSARTFALNSLSGLEVVSKGAEAATYRGRRVLRLLQSTEQDPTGQTLAIINGSDFKDGVIETELAGMPRTGAADSIRGFVGIAFRVQPHGAKYEAFYLRMTNGRSDDQVRRNHSAQYICEPDFPWERLRKENPGVYESYVDLEPGAWTRVKIVVAGTKASLYVNGSSQPCLVVNDLKLGETHGQIALWAGQDTDAYFSKLTVK